MAGLVPAIHGLWVDPAEAVDASLRWHDGNRVADAAAGLRVKTGPGDHYPLKQMRLVKFNGTAWVPFGEPISG